MSNQYDKTELAELSKGYVQDFPIDARKWSNGTLQKAYEIGLIEAGDSRKWQFASHFDFSYMMPADSLWELCKGMIEAHSGASIQKHNDWKTLNIFDKNSYHFSDRDINDMTRILIKLDMHGYIYFRSAGSVWTISIRKDNPQ